MCVCFIQIYYADNNIWRVSGNGTRIRAVSGSGGWGATSTTCMATYNKNRIFAIWSSTLYEVLESSYASFGSGGYSTGSALVQLGSYMFTTTGSSQNGRLRRITINGSSATIEPWGSVGVYSLGLTTVVGGEYI